ncbi:uncharacterized protein LOC115755478 isoform X1 [Rhodamnia argentea]|uniref:Uncharacterized protein LOC115755478 isoform X1 n=2 Tax=Rhodamnia argentea TaxID=178133 RepID=A0A8B8QWQ3_9MYRT|nr:uncharacterized protein LOC115755478 isoform X1 [Rhodamnia argentea]
MERSPSPSPSPPCEGSRELQCVGKLEIVNPKPVGFLCGSIPVLTDNALHAFNSALVPSRQTVSAPRYQMLPTETDLNRPPVAPNFSEKLLPTGALLSRMAAGDLPWEDSAITSSFSRKCEALAVSGLVEYGDEIDVIAPADILKQIFKMPYSKARLSIAVHRIGQTLVLNMGPDVEEGEKLIKRHSQSQCAEQALFLNFAMHSVRVEACDCPPTHNAASSKDQSSSSVLPGIDTSNTFGLHDDIAEKEQLRQRSEYPQIKQTGFLWESKSKRNKRCDPVKKTTQVSEKNRNVMQESDRHRRVANDGFLRVLFWQFHNFRMLLGSDLLLFSNEKYVAVSLHLWDITRQVTPLTWLEAWLDNIMASAPELAICYHRNGVVQGYELLKTEDIFLLKGISDDGTPAFNPHVVQQNGLSVLRFLQDNCKQDPGAYWLYKGAGEDVIQLFDLAVIPKNHASDSGDDGSSSLPSPMHRGRSDSLFSLGTLLYRIAHRLSLSVTPKDKAKCASFIRKCLELLDEPDQLVVRALAHEQYARLILNSDDQDVDLASESVPEECEVKVTDVEEESLDFWRSISDSNVQDDDPSVVLKKEKCSEVRKGLQDLASEASLNMSLEASMSASRKLITSSDIEKTVSEGGVSTSGCNDHFAICKRSPVSTQVIQTVADPISSKLAAINHVSQAIKSLRWMRQLQSNEAELVDCGTGAADGAPLPMNFAVCACGDADCIEVCDIREWLPTSKLDHKLWKLILLLGESYLALAQAYKEEGELLQALKVVELACSVYGSMPQHLKDTRFISSMVSCSTSFSMLNDTNGRTKSKFDAGEDVISTTDNDHFTSEQFSFTYLFWAKAWTLVGDVYVQFHMIKGKEVSIQTAEKRSMKELRMSSEVVKEVKRLKKKLGQLKQNCSLCSLVNCSCQSDRVSSGSSASSSTGDSHVIAHSRRQGRKSHSRRSSLSNFVDTEDESTVQKVDKGRRKKKTIGTVPETFDITRGTVDLDSSVAAVSKNDEDSSEKHAVASKGASETGSSWKEVPKKIGGIFRYVVGAAAEDTDCNLLSALSCYEEARKALGGVPAGSAELQSIMKKKGWVCNEIGRNMLERKELSEAEVAFADAIIAFREVSDHTNIILINCNLGHGRRALAEEMVAKIGHLKSHSAFRDSYKQALVTAKFEYCEALKFYGAAKSELRVVEEDEDSVSESLKNEVYTQYAHTYLRLGMFLAEEDTTADVYENAALEEISLARSSYSPRRAKDLFLRKHEITANEAIREALSVYESLGELRKQEAAYAYFQLACYQRDCCVKFQNSNHKKGFSKGENSILQRVKQYALLAERNWQKAADFYGPQTHPAMYLTILMERSDLSSTLSSSLHSNAMLEASLSRLLDGHQISETTSNALKASHPGIHAKFWGQLQKLLKNMLASTLAASGSKSPTHAVTSKPGDAVKLKELYTMSLKSTEFSQLHVMHSLWIS